MKQLGDGFMKVSLAVASESQSPMSDLVCEFWKISIQLLVGKMLFSVHIEHNSQHLGVAPV